MQQTSNITLSRVGHGNLVHTVLFKVVGDELVAGSQAYIVQPKGRAWVTGRKLSVEATKRAWLAPSDPPPVVYGPELPEFDW